MVTDEKLEYVYGTFLVGDEYTKGVIALYRSLLSTGTIYPFIVFASKCSSDTIDRLVKAGCKVLHVESLTPPPNIAEKNKRAGFERWNETFSKLRILSFEQYEKIILLDSDMMVQKNIDCLFASEHMSAVAAGNHARPTWVDLNSGLMVIRPSKEEFDKAVDCLITISNTESLLEKYPLGIGDQDIMQAVYPDWVQKENLHLSEKFNLFQDCLTRYESQGFVKAAEVSVIHFELNPKPWDYSISDYIKIAYRLIRYHSTAELKAYLRYRAFLEE